MPLPEEPFTIHGGCACHALRYTASIPAYAQRWLHPRHPQERFPQITIDHCNDCRAASASPAQSAFIAPAAYFEFSSVPRSLLQDLPAAGTLTAFPDSDPRRLSAGAYAALTAGSAGPFEKDGFLGTWRSSAGVYRGFCTRCGTGVSYLNIETNVDQEGFRPEGQVMDVWLAGIDREDLERWRLEPMRHVWWDMSLGWVRELFGGGEGGEGVRGLPRHPTYVYTELAD